MNIDGFQGYKYISCFGIQRFEEDLKKGGGGGGGGVSKYGREERRLKDKRRKTYCLKSTSNMTCDVSSGRFVKKRMELGTSGAKIIIRNE